MLGHRTRYTEWFWWSLLHYTFYLLSLPPIVLLSYCLFWHPGQWFDGTPNLGSSFWMIHYDLLPVTCQLPPATWYLRHLWRQKQVGDKCEVYASPYLLLRDHLKKTVRSFLVLRVWSRFQSIWTQAILESVVFCRGSKKNPKSKAQFLALRKQILSNLSAT